MKNPITPLEAVQKSESYQSLVNSISIRLSCGETRINFNDYEVDLMIGKDFTPAELAVALNAYRLQGWEIHKVKGYIYQFAPETLAVATSSSARTYGTPMTPAEHTAKADSVDEVVEHINMLLGEDINHQTRVYANPLLNNYSKGTIYNALKKFEDVGWSVSACHNPEFHYLFQKL